MAGRPKVSVELMEQWQRLIGLGQRELAQGNISNARQYLLRAAETGSAAAALRLAETYDGERLRRLNVVGLKADADQARHWYERAGQLGASEAADRLQHLKNSN